MTSRGMCFALACVAGAVFAQQGEFPIGPAPNRRPEAGLPHSEFLTYKRAVEKTASMAHDDQARRLAARHGLDVLNLTWEDAGRYKGSSVGPNISDMTIQVWLQAPDERQGRALAMPVIRYPNFSDKTADVDPMAFTLLVGNQKGAALRRVSLWEFLRDPTPYMTNARSWGGTKPKTLLAPRDSKVLVSAQACFLPVPQKQKATFNPVLFNYQSSQENPAVLTILATREGTSMTVIDNVRDAFSEGAAWGQRLFHNADGQRASLTGQRLSDFKDEQAANPSGNSHVVPDAALNMVLLIQVPLKYRELRPASAMASGASAPGGAAMESKARERASDVEAAVIGHGEMEGPFTELDNLPVERDPRFPVRVTVQFYKATSNGIVDAKDLDEIHREIEGIYAHGSAVGSLVTEGKTGRITEYEGPKVQPPDWWERFWSNYEANTGRSRQEARKFLSELLGRDYMKRPVTDLYLRDRLAERKN